MSEFDVPVAETTAMKRVMELLESVAPGKMPILFYGPAGVGKSFWARFVHSKSSFADGRFIRFSCGCIDREDLISALNERCTLYLQDFSQLHPELQGILFNALNKERVNFRLIVSSRRSLESLVGTKIASKLYYAVSIIPVEIPALSGRKEDIMALSNVFIKKYSTMYKKNLSLISPRDLRSFCDTYWKANVRGLRDFIELTFRTREIDDLTDISSLLPNQQPFGGRFLPLKDAMDKFRKEYVTEILVATNWNKTRASEILKVQRTYLPKLIANLDIKK